MGALQGNVWGNAKGKATGGADRPAAQPTPVQAEHHVPVRDFNAGEVKEFLKKSTFPATCARAGMAGACGHGLLRTASIPWS